MLELLYDHSYVAIVVTLVLTGAGLPVPEEVVVILAAVVSHQEMMNPWLALAACLVGALLGDCVMYGIGYHFGHGMLRDHRWFARYLRPEREQRVEELINKHGLKVFILARFLVGLRSPVYLTAGILRVPFRRFIVADAFCATMVVSSFFGLGYLFAERIRGWWIWIRGAEYALTFTVIAAILGVAAYFYLRHRRRVERIRARRRLRSLRLRVPQETTMQESKSAG